MQKDSLNISEFAPNRIDDEIERWLRDLLDTYALDRIDLWQYAEPERRYLITNVRCAAGIEPLPTEILTEQDIPWIAGQVQQNRIVAWSSPQELAEKAKIDAETMDRAGVLSALVLPLRVAGESLGALQATTLRARRAWPGELVDRLSLIAKIFAGDLERQRLDEKLRQSQAESQRQLSFERLNGLQPEWFLENCIEGIWRVDLDKPIPVDLPEHKQIDQLYQYAYFGEFNKTLAEAMPISIRCLRRFFPPSPKGWGWAWRSIARLSKATADGCGLKITPTRVQRFAFPYR